MWTVAGKGLFSLLFLTLIELALSASQPPSYQLQLQNKCMSIFLNLFDDLDRNDLEFNPIFQSRVNSAKNSVIDPFCSSKLSSPRMAADFMRFIWRDRPEFACNFRAQNTSLSSDQAQATCETARTHDIVALEGNDRNVVIVGETHKKDFIAAKNAANLLNFFPIRGIEGFSGDIELQLNSGVSNFALAILTDLGILSNSTTLKSLETGYYFGFDGQKDFLMINQVRARNLSVNRTNPFRFLEKLEEPTKYPVTINLERSTAIKELIEKNCQSLNSCSDTKRTRHLIYLRNSDMAENITKILNVLPKNQDLLVIVGAQHVSDLANRVTCQNKMTGRVLSDSHRDYPMTYDFNACQRIVKI